MLSNGIFGKKKKKKKKKKNAPPKKKKKKKNVLTRLHLVHFTAGGTAPDMECQKKKKKKKIDDP